MMNELDRRLDQALRRVLTSGIWDDPRLDVRKMLEEFGFHARGEAEWELPAARDSEYSLRMSEYLFLAMQWSQRLRQELQNRSFDALTPVRPYVDELKKLVEVVDSVSEAIISLDREYRILSWNKAAQKLFGRSSSEVMGKFLPDMVPGVLTAAELDEYALWARRGGNPERELQWSKGSWVNLRVLLVCDADGRERGLAVVLRDCTRQRQQQVRLEELAWSDPLTNLPNRAWLMAELEGWLEKLARVPKRRFAVVLVGLDRFKAVNDTMGHTAGDRLLCAVAKRVGESLQRGDRIARLGGDEFTVLLEGVSDGVAAQRATRKLQELFRLPLVFEGGEEHYASVSVGVALAEAGMEAEELLRNADIALYTAKARGPDQVQVFNAALRTSVAERAEMDEALRRDVERFLLADPDHTDNPFVAHFQPILSLDDDRIDGFEALLRWHWKGVMISPIRFVKAAEDSGLIVPIGRWVLGQACRQLRGWKNRFGSRAPRSINVNVSVRQLRHPGYVEDVAAIIRETGLEPDMVNLEITESSFLEDEDATRLVIGGLEKIGVKLSMDDFGTGYSSFSYLSRLPFSSIKVDRSFVCRITAGEREERLVRSIVHLALDLGMSATAEGVELLEEYQRLKVMRCPRMQGYWLSKPMPTEAALAFLEKRL